MSKMQDILARNRDAMREDAGERPAGNAPPAVTRLDGRTRLANAAAIALDRIVADAQHREAFDEDGLRRLAASLVAEGQLQPIRVRWDQARGLYVVIAGERRLRAARLAGLATLDCVVADDEIDGKTTLVAQVVENALREDLRPLEKARAFKAVMDLEGLDGRQLADRLHVDPSTVSRTLALLRLPEDVQRRVDAGELPPTAAVKAVGRGAGKPAGRRAGAPAKERAFKVAGGLTVTVKGRRALGDAEVYRALEEALGQRPAGNAAA